MQKSTEQRYSFNKLMTNIKMIKDNQSKLSYRKNSVNKTSIATDNSSKNRNNSNIVNNDLGQGPNLRVRRINPTQKQQKDLFVNEKKNVWERSEGRSPKNVRSASHPVRERNFKQNSLKGTSGMPQALTKNIQTVNQNLVWHLKLLELLFSI